MDAAFRDAAQQHDKRWIDTIFSKRNVHSMHLPDRNRMQLQSLRPRLPGFASIAGYTRPFFGLSTSRGRLSPFIPQKSAFASAGFSFCTTPHRIPIRSESPGDFRIVSRRAETLRDSGLPPQNGRTVNQRQDKRTQRWDEASKTANTRS